MHCRNCGEFLDDQAKFCTSCGAKQTAPAASVCPQEEQPQVHQGYVDGIVKKISPIDAVKSFFVHYADFQGRARRSEYWWVVLFNTIIGSIIGATVPDFAGIWSLVILVPTLALVVRRLHDTGKSGWFYLWMLLPLAGPIIVLIRLLKDSAEDNQWGPNPKR